MSKIRVQPQDVDIPKGDPFANDSLDRREAIETLTRTIGNIAGPCIIGVDAPWGAGKTTFVKMWASYLRSKDFTVVQFSAWETDYSGDPFLALSGEIISEFKNSDNSRIKKAGAAIAIEAGRLVKQNLPLLMRTVGSAVPIVGPSAGAVLGDIAENLIAQHDKSRNSIRAFRDRLEKVAGGLAESEENLPLIVIIDELDRCRPSYAVELLETAKHIFSVNNVVFVLSTHREQLAHALTAVYGDRFDAAGYLGRFFDIDFRLPEVDRQKFIQATLSSTQISERYRQSPSLEVLATFLNDSGLTLRDIAKAINHLALVVVSMRVEGERFQTEADVAVALMILRAIDYPTYRLFVEGSATHQEVIQHVFVKLRKNTVRTTVEGAFYQAVIFLANREMTSDTMPLQEAADQTLTDDNTYGIRSSDLMTCSQFHHYVGRFAPSVVPHNRVDYLGIVRTIELFSQERLVGVVPLTH